LWNLIIYLVASPENNTEPRFPLRNYPELAQGKVRGTGIEAKESKRKEREEKLPADKNQINDSVNPIEVNA